MKRRSDQPLALAVEPPQTAGSAPIFFVMVHAGQDGQAAVAQVRADDFFCRGQILAVVWLVVGKERLALADDEGTGQHFVGLLVVGGEGDHVPA